MAGVCDMRTSVVARRSTGGVHERTLEPDPPLDQLSSGYSSSDPDESELDDELEQLAASTYDDMKSSLTNHCSSDSDTSGTSCESDDGEETPVSPKKGHDSRDCVSSVHSPSEPSDNVEFSRPQFIIDKTPGLSRGDIDSPAFKSPDVDSCCSDDDGSSADEEISPTAAKTYKTSSSSKKKHNITGPKRKKSKQKKGLGLSSSLQSGLDPADVYLNAVVSADSKVPAGYHLNKARNEKLLKQSVIGPDFEKKDQIPPYAESLHQKKKQRQLERDRTKGKGWFDLPAQEMTEEKRNDLMVVKMRRALDPKHFYKGSDIRGLPKYFQVGTVVENPADFYHSRIPKKQRKSTLVDELLADAEFRKYNKRKYAEIMESKTPRHQGALRHMKRLKKKKT